MFSEYIIGKLFITLALFILFNLCGVSFKLLLNAHISVEFMSIRIILNLFGLRKLMFQFFKFGFKCLSFFNFCTQRFYFIKVKIDFTSFAILSNAVIIIFFAANSFFCNSALRQCCDFPFKFIDSVYNIEVIHKNTSVICYTHYTPKICGCQGDNKG